MPEEYEAKFITPHFSRYAIRLRERNFWPDVVLREENGALDRT